MAYNATATDSKTGDKFVLYLGMNYGVSVNNFLMEASALPDVLNIRDVPTLVQPAYSLGRKFIQATWVKSCLHLTKDRHATMGDWAHSPTRIANRIISTAEVTINTADEFELLGYIEDGTPRLANKKEEEKTWQNRFSGRSITLPCQIYQMAPIHPSMFPPMARAYYPYARDTEAIRTYQEGEVSPRHSELMNVIVTRGQPGRYTHGGAYTSEIYRRQLHLAGPTGPAARRLDFDDNQEKQAEPIYGKDPAKYKVTITNNKVAASASRDEAGTSAQQLSSPRRWKPPKRGGVFINTKVRSPAKPATPTKRKKAEKPASTSKYGRMEDYFPSPGRNYREEDTDDSAA